MFEECLKNVFPDYPLSFYFCAGEGVGVDVALVEDYSFDAVISVTFLLYFSSSPSSITVLTGLFDVIHRHLFAAYRLSIYGF